MLDPRVLTRDRIRYLRWSSERARQKGVPVHPVAIDELDALLDVAEACTCQPIQPAMEDPA